MSGQTSSPASGKIEPKPCQYKLGKILGRGTYSVVREAIHIETGRYFFLFFPL